MPASRPYVLGLTGGIGCGKSEAARLLTSLGAAHVDADAISRALTAPGGAALSAIRETFGESVFRPDGALDRAALGEIVFSDPSAKERLEGIVHPLVWAEARREIAAADAPVAVLDVPLLFESGMDALCDETWAMAAPEGVQVARVMERDGLTEVQAQARIASQMPDAERRARAGRVIDSDRPVEETRCELRRLYGELLERIGEDTRDTEEVCRGRTGK